MESECLLFNFKWAIFQLCHGEDNIYSPKWWSMMSALHFFLNDASLPENQQIPLLEYSVWSVWDSNQQSTSLDQSTMQFIVSILCAYIYRYTTRNSSTYHLYCCRCSQHRITLCWHHSCNSGADLWCDMNNKIQCTMYYLFWSGLLIHQEKIMKTENSFWEHTCYKTYISSPCTNVWKQCVVK